MKCTFHVILTLLAVFAARLKRYDLHNIIVQSLIVAECSTDTIFAGSHAYKSTAQVHKILYEAFPRILLDDVEMT